MSKRSIRQHILAVLACTLLGALLLSACSSATHNPTGAAPLIASTQGVSPTLQSEGDAQLQAFQQWIMLMQQNGGDISTYQLEYNSDQQALVSATTAAKYTTVLTTLTSHVQTIKIPAMKQECLHLQQQLQHQVSTWGAQHTFHDSFNGRTYALGYQYDSSTGIGGPVWLQEEMQTNRTLADYQQTVEDLNMWIYNFQQMQIEAGDTTPFNQIHQADLHLLKHYGYMDERVVVVSLIGESLRAYDHGQLVKAFQVTTGQPDLPSPPGAWWIEGKKHPTVFKSTAPKGSSEWYPDTPINYAMQYHSNGYFFHDAWWRTQFGPGTNFPHQDPNGDPFAGQGSHGCVNMSTSDAAWLYDFVSVFTNIVIY
jgi:hypothetical protein